MNKIYLEDEVLIQKKQDPIKKKSLTDDSFLYLSKHESNNFLAIKNYLSEYKTELEKRIVKLNLGIKDLFKTINGESIFGTGNFSINTLTDEEKETLENINDILTRLENIKVDDVTEDGQFVRTLEGWKLIENIIPHIGNNGNWFVGNNDTGVSAKGDAPKIEIIDGYWHINNKPTSEKAQGDSANIEAAELATINANAAAINANYAAEKASNVNVSLSGTTITVTDRDGQQHSSNIKGDNGVGISKINISESQEDGGNNEITLTLSDNSTTTFNVKNGSKGDPGENNNIVDIKRKVKYINSINDLPWNEFANEPTYYVLNVDIEISTTNILANDGIYISENSIFDFNDKQILLKANLLHGSTKCKAVFKSPFNEIEINGDNFNKYPKLTYRRQENYIPYQLEIATGDNREKYCGGDVFLEGMFRINNDEFYINDFAKQYIAKPNKLFSSFVNTKILVDSDIWMYSYLDTYGGINSNCTLSSINDAKIIKPKEESVSLLVLNIVGNNVTINNLNLESCEKFSNDADEYAYIHYTPNEIFSKVLYNITNNKFTHVIIDNTDSNNIEYVFNISNNIFEGYEFNYFLSSPIDKSYHALSFKNIINSNIKYNNISYYHYGIQIKNAINNEISFNTFDTIRYISIWLKTLNRTENKLSGFMHNNIIKNNIIKRNSEEAISLDGAGNHTDGFVIELTDIESSTIQPVESQQLCKFKANVIIKYGDNTNNLLNYKNCFIISLHKDRPLNYALIDSIEDTETLDDQGNKIYKITCNLDTFNNAEIKDKYLISSFPYNNTIQDNTIIDSMTAFCIYGKAISNSFKGNKIIHHSISTENTANLLAYMRSFGVNSDKIIKNSYICPVIDNVFEGNVFNTNGITQNIRILQGTNDKIVDNLIEDVFSDCTTYSLKGNKIISNYLTGDIKIYDALNTSIINNSGGFYLNNKCKNSIVNLLDILTDNTSMYSKLLYNELTDKEYNEETFSGKGRKYLRKNIIEGQNVLTLNMINNPNTTYIILYDFIINSDIEIPNNCILDFKGGSIDGEYSIIFNSTLLTGSPKVLCNFSGNVTNDNYNITYFGCVGDGTTDNSKNLLRIFNNCIDKTVFIPDGTFLINKTINIPIEGADGKLNLKGVGRSSILKSNIEGDIITFKYDKNIKNLKCNITMSNFKVIGTTKTTFFNTEVYTTWFLAKNIYISKCNIGFNIPYNAYWCRFDGCSFKSCNIGLNLGHANSTSITNCEFRTLNDAGIRILPVLARNGEFLHTTFGMNISGCDFSEITRAGIHILGVLSNSSITGNYFETGYGTDNECGEIVVGYDENDWDIYDYQIEELVKLSSKVEYTSDDKLNQDTVPKINSILLEGNSGLWEGSHKKGILNYGIMSGCVVNAVHIIYNKDDYNILGRRNRGYATLSSYESKYINTFSDLWTSHSHHYLSTSQVALDNIFNFNKDTGELNIQIESNSED